MRIVIQEHRVWSTFTRASTATANCNTVSSLVFSEDFIYSYHFTEQRPGDNSHFLKLVIYARHEDAYDDNSVDEYSDIVAAMRRCLEVGRTSLRIH